MNIILWSVKKCTCMCRILLILFTLYVKTWLCICIIIVQYRQHLVSSDVASKVSLKDHIGIQTMSLLRPHACIQANARLLLLTTFTKYKYIFMVYYLLL